MIAGFVFSKILDWRHTTLPQSVHNDAIFFLDEVLTPVDRIKLIRECGGRPQALQKLEHRMHTGEW